MQNTPLSGDVGSHLLLRGVRIFISTRMPPANPTSRQGIVDDNFFSWSLGAHYAELDRLQHILDPTCECLNLEGTDDESSYHDQYQWNQATPELFSVSTPISGGA